LTFTEKTPIRTAFFTGLQTRVYSYLRTIPILKEWTTKDLFSLSTALINQKRDVINAYLDEKGFSLKQTEAAMNDVMIIYIIPEIEKIKI
jgi:hypothetical protein